MNQIKAFAVGLVIQATLLVGGNHLYGAAQLSLSNGSTTVIVADNGPDDANPGLGVITYNSFNGPLSPTWTFTATVGVTKPVGGSPAEPYMDIGSTSRSSQAGLLTIEFTDTDFTASGTGIASVGGALPQSGGSITFNVWMDAANNPFAKTTSLASIGPLGPPPSGTTNAPVTAFAPYSLTLQTIINHVSAGQTHFDSEFLVIPCTGKIGDFVWRDLNANGFQDAGEPGINGVQVNLLDAANNLLATTTTATFGSTNGYYQFTNLCDGTYKVVVVGSSPALAGLAPTVGSAVNNDGSMLLPNAAIDSNNPDGTTVTLGAVEGRDNQTLDFGYVTLIREVITLACASGGGQVGVPYNSALVASGGTPPYTFSIIVGSLPPGLTLNPSTGEITGTPTEAGDFIFIAKVVDSSGASATAVANCGIHIIGVGGCRVTGGSNHQLNSSQSSCITTPLPTFISHGGQVGAAYSTETPFTPNSVCISGEWQHNRHLTHNSLVGVLHAAGNGNVRQFDSLLCACLPCDENPLAVGVVGSVCNPGDRICGPLPRRAPANKICFSGVGDYTFTNGKKTVKAVFRVDIEDRSEGNSHASQPPADRYRIRIWLLDPSCGRNPDPSSPEAMALRLAASADPATIATLATTENLKVIPGYVTPAPDIDDGGDMTQGNHQIHPATGAVCTP